MTVLKFLLMLVAGAIGVLVTVLVSNLLGRYQIVCFGPLVAGGAAGISGLIIRKRNIGSKAVVLLVFLLFALSLVSFERVRYQAWRQQFIHFASQTDAAFAALPSGRQEELLEEELKDYTGHSGYMAYLMFPRFDFTLSLEVIEGSGVEAPVNITFKGILAVITRLLTKSLVALVMLTWIVIPILYFSDDWGYW